MNPTSIYENTRHEHLQRLCALTLKDDIFFSKCMHKQNACMALILNIILKNPGISMKDVNDQEDIYNLTSRSIRLYVLAHVDQCGNSAFKRRRK